MSVAARLIAKFGDPIKDPASFEKANLTVWTVPANLAAKLPFKKIYCNKYLVKPLEEVFKRLDEKGLLSEIKTFDGCFNIRKVRGSATEPSVHSWAMAVDFNAKENGLGMPVKFSKAFLDVWRECGWTCGADFKRLDGMHFQYTPLTL